MNSTVNQDELARRIYARQRAIDEGLARKKELEQVETSIALETQVGGSHYNSMKIQPIEYTMANAMNPLQHTAIKYLSRYQSKGTPIEDLKKAIHSIELLIQFEENKDE